MSSTPRGRAVRRTSPEPSPSPATVVQDGYDRLGDRYLRWGGDSSVRRRFLAEVLERLSPSSAVVELGCGPGDPVTAALSEGHDVTAVDVSAHQIDLARTVAPAARFLHADMTQLTLPAQCADAVVSFYALGHLPPEAHRPLFSKIENWLRPGGFLLTSTPVATSDVLANDRLGVPMYFGGIGTMATLTALREAGLVVEHAEEVEEDEDGTSVTFLWVTAVKPPVAGG